MCTPSALTCSCTGVFARVFPWPSNVLRTFGGSAPHTICEQVQVRSNRIGIDTGAYWTGVLTAIGLERAERWLLQTFPKSPNSQAQSMR